MSRISTTVIITRKHVRQNFDYINISDAMIEDFGSLDELDLTNSMFICNEGVEKFVLMASEKRPAIIEGYFEGWGYSCKTSNNEVKTFASYAVSFTHHKATT